MSSDDLYGSINSNDISLLREVPAAVGLTYSDSMTERDRDAARFAIAQYQHGVRCLAERRCALAKRVLLAAIPLTPSREG